MMNLQNRGKSLSSRLRGMQPDRLTGESNGGKTNVGQIYYRDAVRAGGDGSEQNARTIVRRFKTSGFRIDSLSFALIVMRLEESLDSIRSVADEVKFPVTFSDFVGLYESHRKSDRHPNSDGYSRGLALRRRR